MIGIKTTNPPAPASNNCLSPMQEGQEVRDSLKCIRLAGCIVLFLAAVLLTGCDDDPPDHQVSMDTHRPYYVQGQTTPIGTPPDSSSSDSIPDSLTDGTKDDPMDSDTHPLDSDVEPSDTEYESPLLDDGKTIDESDKNLVQNGAGLANGESSLDERAGGKDAKPTHFAWLKGIVTTDNSHWLRGTVSGSHLAVSINGNQCGDFQGHIDEDVSRFCRKGSNTVIFTYTPTVATALASVNLIESEHTPPIPPLATFENVTDAPAFYGDKKLHVVTKTGLFIAH